MRYEKPPLSFEEQVDLLLGRGMRGDRAVMSERLAAVSYYRLSAYWFHLRVDGGDRFRPGATFDEAWNRYVFDRALRLLVMDAVERIEIAVRTQLSYHHAHAFKDPFAYATSPAALPDPGPAERKELLAKVEQEVARSHAEFVRHFWQKYGDSHQALPIWMATETMSFGSMLRLYSGCPSYVRAKIATYFRIPEDVLKSWLVTLNTVRNVCAHHGRLWNRAIGTKPKIPRPNRYPQWHSPVDVLPDRLFAVLSICSYCLGVTAPESAWPARVRELLDRYPTIPKRNMGFPDNWLESPLWARAR